MGIKSFILGAAAAYGIQHITKKRIDGSSILSDFMDNPPELVKKAQTYATEKVDDLMETAANRVNL